eukprot:TRINITY_DN24892_c0_g1_i1.p3 TRINITY_DN24892_c0_g1~~TRINITY_DN24892_c0_g1_i1.p3  ORF type:complete len:124 (+),score=1.02 TRINITY_DN24892_c0_g1_i1:187-558(+)
MRRIIMLIPCTCSLRIKVFLCHLCRWFLMVHNTTHNFLRGLQVRIRPSPLLNYPHQLRILALRLSCKVRCVARKVLKVVCSINLVHGNRKFLIILDHAKRLTPFCKQFPLETLQTSGFPRSVL